MEMNGVRWENIRSFQGTQNNAFEELVCQLAGNEQIDGSKQYIRKGVPDAGVEAFWFLENDDEWAWQAKFFLRNPGPSEWSQIDESVKTALDKHPRMVKYFVCLPIDRSDARVGRTKSMLDKWNLRVAKWTKWAKERNRGVIFEYWGNHELVERLTLPINTGKLYFWFQQEELSDEWFRRKLENRIKNLGARYCEELNIDLPIAKVFDGIGRTKVYKEEFQKIGGAFIKESSQVSRKVHDDKLDEEKKTIEHCTQNILHLYKQLRFDAVDKIDFKTIKTNLQEIIVCCDNARQKIRLLVQEDIQKKRGKEEEGQSNLNNLLANFWELKESCSNFIQFLEAPISKLFNHPVLLMFGEAGKGKSHLLADVAHHRKSPTILLLGQHFYKQDPWTQILNQLGLDCKKEELLGALNSIGESQKERIVFMIDALNEGDGRLLWSDHLSGLIDDFHRYPWVGLVLSVRTSYKKVIVPENVLQNEKVTKVTHEGFVNVYNAIKRFFSFYNIEQPRIPLLVPEFQNPLFLKLFCEGLNKAGMNSIPNGLDGVTSIYAFLIDATNKVLSSPGRLDYPGGINLVADSLKLIALKIIETSNRSISLKEATILLEQELRKYSNKSGLLNELIKEGLLAANIFYFEEEAPEERIYFMYERFGDHMCTKFLLDHHLDRDKPRLSFRKGKPLHRFFQRESVLREHQGIIEAMSIQLPEQTGKELYELVPSYKNHEAVIDGFIESLSWRKPETIDKKLTKYFNSVICENGYYYHRLWSTFILNASDPNFYFNGDYIHQSLFDKTLPERDASWTILCCTLWTHKNSALRRVIDWAWSNETKDYISDESMLLLAQTIVWLLTSSNRFLRDKATKALVAMLEGRDKILIELLQKFKDVNDPYVSERLYAVAYGVALRENEHSKVFAIAQVVYELIFQEGKPPVHILLRDYARGIVEYAIHLNPSLEFKLDLIRPPYNSEWVDEIPSDQYVKSKDIKKEETTRQERAQSWLLFSITGWDFSRYILGSNTGYSPWSNIMFLERQSYKEMVQMDIDIFKLYESLKQLASLDKELIMRRSGVAGLGEVEDILQDLPGFENELMATLNKEDQIKFSKYVNPFLDKKYAKRNEIYNRVENYFPVKDLQHLIVKRVFDLGWSQERFGDFDANIQERDRGTRKQERIGKKYQWIAYHETLARMSDNFEFYGTDRHSQKVNKYQGPWQLWIRDIDPSHTTKSKDVTPLDIKMNWPSNFVEYKNWDVDNSEWIKSKIDLPAPSSFLEIEDNAGNSWITLQSSPDWSEPEDPMKTDNALKKSIWYQLRGYLIRKNKLKKTLKWAKDQHFMGRWMPESSEQYRLFSREFFWSPAFYEQRLRYEEESPLWNSPDKAPSDIDFLVPTQQFIWSSEYDCSDDERISYYLPEQLIFEGMRMQYSERAGVFINDNKEVICFDSRVLSEGKNMLLLKKEPLLKFLRENDFALIWTLLGEKQILTGLSRMKTPFPKILEFSGVYYLDETSSEIKGDFTIFKEDDF